MTSMKRELRLLNRHLNRHQAVNGEGVLWYEYQGVQPTSYLLEGTRRYQTPVAVPCLWVTETEDMETGTAEGRRLTPTLSLAVSMETLIKSGLSDPHDSERHINDLIQYQRTFYNVGRYNIRGRMAREDVIVGVSGVKVFPDEDMVFDQLPTGATPNHTVKSKPEVFVFPQYFPDHEDPANNEP